MDSKQTTLYSKTRQCPYCGEEYSVTYEYCPFCETAAKEAEKEARRQAEARRSNSLFGKLGRSSQADANRKKASSGGEQNANREKGFTQDAGFATLRKKDGTRLKTSEMTEEQKVQSLREREARAAERKRERERKAREAALVAVAGGAKVVLEENPETVGKVKLYQQPEPATVEETVQPTTKEETAAQENAPDTTEIYQPASVDETPVSVAVETAIGQTVVPVTPIEAETATTPTPPVEEAAAESAEKPAEEAPTEEAATSFSPESLNVPKPTEYTSEEERELDALLNEVRGMLEDSPVPILSPEELEKRFVPANAVSVEVETEETTISQETPAVSEAPQAEALSTENGQPPAQETASAVETAPTEEPAALSVEEIIATADIPATEAIAEKMADTPTVEEIIAEKKEELEDFPPLEQIFPADWLEMEPSDQPVKEDIPYVPLVQTKPKSRQEVPKEKETPKAKEPTPVKEAPPSGTKKKKKSSRPLPFILSLVVILAAICIIIKVLPHHETAETPTDPTTSVAETGSEAGLPAAESMTLDQTQVKMTEPGAAVTLVPLFEPEGSSAAVTWTSSNEEVAPVEQNGTVVGLVPGTAVITATMENGFTAECTISCAWTAGPTLNARDITLDSQGATQTLTLTGTEGTANWSSNKPDVAKVSSDGTVTAVGKGSATITAAVDGKNLTCEVRCIW